MCHVLFLRVKDTSVPNAGGESESYWYVGSPQNLQQIENFLTPVAISSPVKNFLSTPRPGRFFADFRPEQNSIFPRARTRRLASPGPCMYYFL